MVKHKLQDIPKRAFSVGETAYILGGLSDKSIYRLLARKKLKALIGLRHKLITAESINAYLALSNQEAA
jgi:hypothetical protein